MSGKQLKVYFVLGEESGDALAADLLIGLRNEAENRGIEVQASGLAGPKLSALGVTSLFDISDIAVMGISAVLARLPSIINRIHRTVDDAVTARPDVIVLVDSPDFTHAVGKRVRAKMPDVPIIKYVCPSVWAWRPGRALKMAAFIDHVLTILPFEPSVLHELGGPEATYVGHPLASNIAARSNELPKGSNTPATLLVLPGSRGSEVKRMLPVFGQTLDLLAKRGIEFNAVLPAVPHLRDQIRDGIADWTVQPQIVDSADNSETFQTAHAALAASGTVLLQLALNRVPMISCYKLDPLATRLLYLVKAWSAALPNLIAGWPLVSEYYNGYVNAEKLSRELERLLTDTPERAAQLAGFDVVAEKLETDTPTAQAAAKAIFSVIETKNPGLLTGV
ncbi:lipid-A-disaccharide synthase [Pseudahrensia aquimaris]|uniref:Lipid-A-disaccharide synthase n=1 Tax=Pseudahrensia aquimaris TaxID=744461 RepID=A0ABW3FG86_9HYPH